MSAEPGMTSREREQLAKVVRLNERVAKAQAKQRAAELRADFESKLAARFSYDDHKVWKEAHRQADEAVKAAQERVAQTFAELGIPKAFAPGLSLGWYGRGESATASRRTELTKVVASAIESNLRAALAAIEAKSAEVQTAIIVGGLTSAEARAFVESIPALEALMPALALDEIEAAR